MRARGEGERKEKEKGESEGYDFKMGVAHLVASVSPVKKVMGRGRENFEGVKGTKQKRGRVGRLKGDGVRNWTKGIKEMGSRKGGKRKKLCKNVSESHGFHFQSKSRKMERKGVH